jgi:hypothetical protein
VLCARCMASNNPFFDLLNLLRGRNSHLARSLLTCFDKRDKILWLFGEHEI